MKTVLALLLLITTTSAIPDFEPVENTIIGTWKVVRSQYGKEGIKDRSKDDIYKMFTATRWSSVFYNKAEKKFDGAGGGTYSWKDEKYSETIEYYSWDSGVVGKTFVFTLKIEKGMLHQTGTIEYQGDPKYLIDEWFQRVD